MDRLMISRPASLVMMAVVVIVGFCNLNEEITDTDAGFNEHDAIALFVLMQYQSVTDVQTDGQISLL